MNPHFQHNGTEVSAGQALDAWLAYTGNRDAGMVSGDVHLFADFVYGYSGPENTLREAGVEIRYGDDK
jgi:hypothetical protein